MSRGWLSRPYALQRNNSPRHHMIETPTGDETCYCKTLLPSIGPDLGRESRGPNRTRTAAMSAVRLHSDFIDAAP